MEVVFTLSMEVINEDTGLGIDKNVNGDNMFSANADSR